MDIESLKFYNGYGGFDAERGEYVICENTPLPWINCIASLAGEPFGFLISEKGGGYVWQENSRENPLTQWYCDPASDPSDERYEILLRGEAAGFSPFDGCTARHGFGYSVFTGARSGLRWELTVFVPYGRPVKVSVLSLTAQEQDREVSAAYTVDSVYEHRTFSSAGEGRIYKIKKGDTCGFVFLLAKTEAAFEGVTDYHACLSELERIKTEWSRRLGRIRIKTPDDSINVMMNGRLQYQTISCRINGRTAFYQCGGAYGFRDQLQDSLALLYTEPEEVRSRILLHASRQYEEGDVQHWWHPPGNAGIRSRYSDDLLWLVYVTYRYTEATGDSGILTEQVAFLHSKPLEANEIDRYEAPETTARTDTLLAHCLLACKHALSLGEHGIPLMKGGDWNDGMNRVGIKGKGESVWLGWFLCCCLRAVCKLSLLVPACEADRRALLSEADQIAAAIEKNAWDGNWYVRAFCDDGKILGSSSSSECMIDSISQSWSVLSGYGDPERSKTALLSAERFLVDAENGVIKLLTPPFTEASITDVGYIASYPPGIRENGAQYTHAAIWLAKAFFQIGRKDPEFAQKGRRLLEMLNPVNHSRTRLEAARYKTEPYAVAADVYSGSNLGRGGWSWYTGSAAWLYLVILEEFLGFSVRNYGKDGSAELLLNPSVPQEWNEYTIEYLYKETLYVITLRRQKETEDTFAQEPRVIRLENDGKRHEVLIPLSPL